MNQQQTIEAIAVMIEAAKDILKSAKKMAQDEGIQYSFECDLRDLYDGVSDNYSVDWNSSNC